MKSSPNAFGRAERLNLTASEMWHEVLETSLVEGSALSAWARRLSGAHGVRHCQDGASQRSTKGARCRRLFSLPLPVAGQRVLPSAQATVTSTAPVASPRTHHSGKWSWFVSIVIALNWMAYGCCNYVPPVIPRRPNKSQQSAWDNISAAADRFVGPGREPSVSCGGHPLVQAGIISRRTL